MRPDVRQRVCVGMCVSFLGGKGARPASSLSLSFPDTNLQVSQQSISVHVRVGGLEEGQRACVGGAPSVLPRNKWRRAAEALPASPLLLTCTCSPSTHSTRLSRPPPDATGRQPGAPRDTGAPAGANPATTAPAGAGTGGGRHAGRRKDPLPFTDGADADGRERGRPRREPGREAASSASAPLEGRVKGTTVDLPRAAVGVEARKEVVGGVPAAKAAAAAAVGTIEGVRGARALEAPRLPGWTTTPARGLRAGLGCRTGGGSRERSGGAGGSTPPMVGGSRKERWCESDENLLRLPSPPSWGPPKHTQPKQPSQIH